jgi:hypothetical protein
MTTREKVLSALESIYKEDDFLDWEEDEFGQIIVWHNVEDWTEQ